MKKLIILAVIALASSCSIIRPTAREVVTYFADYREYAAEGFLISPNPYTEDFESIGEIEIVITPAIKQYPEEGQPYDYRGEYLDYESIEYNEIVRIAVEKAKEKGADALVNFAISQTPISQSDADGIRVDGFVYHVKGFCIKRK